MLPGNVVGYRHSIVPSLNRVVASSGTRQLFTCQTGVVVMRARKAKGQVGALAASREAEHAPSAARRRTI